MGKYSSIPDQSEASEYYIPQLANVNGQSQETIQADTYKELFRFTYTFVERKAM